MKHLYYLLYHNDSLIIAAACEPHEFDHFASVTVPYDDRGTKHTVTYYILGKDSNTIALEELVLLPKYAKLLARCGGKTEQYENVAALYKHGDDAETPAMLQLFFRPQDFATRGLDGDMPKWTYRLINYIILDNKIWGDEKPIPKLAKVTWSMRMSMYRCRSQT